jgi:hypothetical protein
MATNNRPLKAYVRYDGSGRAVSSSLIWRKNKPKVGNWKEVQGYECCNPGGGSPLSNTTICAVVDEEIIGNATYRISIQGSDTFVFSSFTTPATLVTTYQELVEFLNTNFSFLGQFTYSAPNQICLQISTGPVTGYTVQNYPSPSSWEFNIIVP